MTRTEKITKRQKYENRLDKVCNALNRYTTFHHSAVWRGYDGVGADIRIERYSGRFGNGYRVFVNNTLSTRFTNCYYYIYKSKYSEIYEPPCFLSHLRELGKASK